MSTEADYEADDDLEPPPDTADGLRQLRERARDARRLERELAARDEELIRLRTDAAFHGLNLSDVQREAVLAIHEGEMTADAVRETVEGLGFFEAPQYSPEEQAAHQRIQETTTGAPAEAKAQSLEDEINAAKSEDEVMAIVRREGLEGQE